jgi:hypothetical protein
MISHTACSHPSTPSARSKCRRARAKGEAPEETTAVERQASIKEVNFERERNTGTTPRDRDKQCDICGVEKTVAWGKDRLRDLHLYVGERCFYYLDPDSQIKVLP